MASINHQYQNLEPKIPDFISKFLPKKSVSFNNWYYELKSSLHFDELTLQNVIKYKIKEHLPNYEVLYYNKRIVSLKDSTIKKIPDFLMWKKDYSEWYVIEVELRNHSINHIREQISTFYDGDYTTEIDDICKYVDSKTANLDIFQFKDMIGKKRPKIMLLADHIRYEWADDFEKYECIFGSIQIYIDENDNCTYRFNGDWPQEFSTFTYCTLNKSLRMLNISNPNFFKNFNIESGSKINLFYRGISESWEFLEDFGSESLIYEGDFLNLDITQNRWKIIRNNKNQFHLLKS